MLKPKFRNAGILAVIVIITYFTFSPALKNGFTNWDDPKYLLDNELVQHLSLKNIKSIFSFENPGGRSYVPLTLITFSLEHYYYRLDPKIYHITNLLLHLLNVCLVFLLVSKISGRVEVPAITALLFGIHPLHVESVAWITERKDVLFSFFYLSSLAAYWNYCNKEKFRAGYFAFSILLFSLSLLSKGMAVTLPMIVLLLDYLGKRKINKKLILEKIPFFLLAITWGIITVIAAQTTRSIAGGEAFSLVERTLFAFHGIVYYLYKLFIPINLSCFYPYPNLIGTRLPMIFYIAPFIVAALAFLVYKSVKHSRIIVFGSLFFLFTIALVLQFFPVGPNIVTDRYTYIPYIGIFFIIGSGYAWLWELSGNKYLLLKGASWVILLFAAGWFAYLAHERCKVWKNSETLWTDVIAKFPNTSEGYLNRGQYYTDNDIFDKALADYEIALQLSPNSTLAYINRGNVYGRRGEYAEALKNYSKAVELSPGSSKIYLNRGNVYGMQEMIDSSIADFSRAISLEPYYLDAYINRAISYSKKRDFEKAFDDFNTALQIHPGSLKTYNMRAYAYLDNGNYDKSIADYNLLLKNIPNEANLYFYRGLAHQRKSDFSMAIKDYSMAIRMNPGNAQAFLNRSLCYDGIKDYSNALQDALTAQKAGQPVGSDYIERLRKK